MDTRDKISSFFLPKTLARERRTNSRAKNFDQLLLLLRFSTPSFQNRCLLLRGFCRRARIHARRIDRAFASRSGFCSFETKAKHHHRVSKKSAKQASFANCRQKNKKKHLGVPRTKTSRVFGRPFLRWTRRSRSKFAKPISRNVVASSFRSWKPTLSRSCEGWTGREKPFFFLSMRAVMRMMKFCTCSSKRFSSSLIFWIDLLLLPLFLFSVKLRKPALFELLYQKK